jgi:hypothetical protein
MLPQALLLLLFLSFVYARPHELTIHRHIYTRRCAIVRARRIPRHRSEHDAVSFSRVLFIGDRDPTVEQLTVFATDMVSLHDHLSHICPDDTLAKLLHTAAPSTPQQHPLANISEDLGPTKRIIPLQVTEITVSGPSSNRVDVTFFSDGCECRLVGQPIPCGH